MCKLLIVLGSKKPKALTHFLAASVDSMSMGNKDGIGYTAIKKDGNIFTERWLENKNAFKGNPVSVNMEQTAKDLGALVDAKIPEEQEYSLQGMPNWSNVPTVMLHTRYATCEKTFDNVHPFVDNENLTSIVHNGVINNDEQFEKLNSTCDSEILLTEYIRRKLNDKPENIVGLIDDLDGYWAVGATSVTSKGNRVIDIFTSNKGYGSGALVVTYVKQLQGYVFCSSTHTLESILKDAKYDHNNPIYEVNNHVFTRFDAITGEMIKSISYEDHVETYEVSTGKHNQSRTHSTGKNATQQRRSLPQNSEKGSESSSSSVHNKTGNNVSSTGAGPSSQSGMGTSVHGRTGNVVDFYGRGKDVLENHDYDDENKRFYEKWLEGNDSIEDYYTNYNKYYDEDDEASDSKYSTEIMLNELSDKEMEELEEFAETIAKEEQELLNDLPEDVKFQYLRDMKREQRGS